MPFSTLIIVFIKIAFIIIIIIIIIIFALSSHISVAGAHPGDTDHPQDISDKVNFC